MADFYGKGLLKGLGITFKHFMNTYLEDIRWLSRGKRRYYTEEGIDNRKSTEARGIFTVQYPDEKLPVPEEFRFIPFLIYEYDIGMFPTAEVGFVLIWIAAMLTIWSMAIYLKSAWPILKNVENNKPQE